jgi:hypothetical protein
MFRIQLSIPRRLHYTRIIVTISLIISVLLSLNLWGGDSLFPDKILVNALSPFAPFSTAFTILSLLLLATSLFYKNHRLLIFFALVINLFLILMDYNRLQPWTYVYNAILFILMFYDGRVDNQAKFASIFINIQMIVAAMYVLNGLSQLNSDFQHSDLNEVLLPLASFSSEKVFHFFLSTGKLVPYFIILTGLGLLIRQTRFLFIAVSLLFHLFLLVLLFPSSHNHNYALWFMNLVFCFLILLLFSGETQQRYFSPAILIQKPLFYMVVFAFWFCPLLNIMNIWTNSPSITFMNGKTSNEVMCLNVNDYLSLPSYLKYFCKKNGNTFELKVNNWCRHELRSESMAHGSFEAIFQQADNNVAKGNVKDSEEELSSL